MNSGGKQEPVTEPGLAEVFQITAPKGEWRTPAIKHVSVGLTFSDYLGKWRGKSGFVSANIVAGDTSICEYDRPRTYTLDRAADFGVIVLSDEVMREVSHETTYHIPEIQTFPLLRDIQLTRLSQILLHEGLTDFENGSLFADSVATALARYLWDKYSASPSPGRNSAGGMAPALLRRSIEYIHANLDRDIRLKDLAREAGVSRSHYIRSFRQSMGITPHQYLLNQRIERAQQLIRQGAASLADVALSCGFADQHHLARNFRRFTGVTPGKFRRSL